MKEQVVVKNPWLNVTNIFTGIGLGMSLLAYIQVGAKAQGVVETEVSVLEKKIEVLEEMTDGFYSDREIENMMIYLDARFQHLDKRLDRIEKRIDEN
jgi:hypothetical protein